MLSCAGLGLALVRSKRSLATMFGRSAGVGAVDGVKRDETEAVAVLYRRTAERSCEIVVRSRERQVCEQVLAHAVELLTSRA